MTHAIGIDFGGTTIKSGLVAGGRIVEYGAIIDTQNYTGPDEIVEALLQVVGQLREKAWSARNTSLGSAITRANSIWRETGFASSLRTPRSSGPRRAERLFRAAASSTASR